MGRTSGVVEPVNESPGIVTHSSGQYRILVNKQAVILSYQGLSPISPPISRFGLSYFVGSRRMGRSYVHEKKGHVYQAPVGYYANRRAWDMAPGYETDQTPDFSRPITAECLFCHGSSAAVAEVNRLVRPDLIRGIGCERCHGDATEHSRLVNPAKLAPRSRDSVCEQCHLSGAARVVKAGRRLADFTPGEDLARYLQVFTDPDAPIRVNGHADSLATSKCRRGSGDRLWCGSCHNPHRETQVNDVCRSCHRVEHAGKVQGSNPTDCTSCHMPKGRARDGGHTVYTDHSIPRRPRAAREHTPEAVVAFFAGDVSPRDLGLAYAQLAGRYRDVKYAERAYALLRTAVGQFPGDAPLWLGLGRLLQAAGHEIEAIAAYERVLNLDPDNTDALTRLANAYESNNNRAKALPLRERLANLMP